ncbi:MAG: OmpH family outer membrane protein [Burkholderiales bacterium]|nr:OmpH family outer membrane protein [Burkholderiales bacterium]
MMKSWKAAAAGALLLASVGAVAQSKIGFVNTERIFRESEPARRAEKKLEGEFSRRERELNDLGNRLRSESEKFDKDSPVLSETQRNQRQRTLAELDRDFQRKQREFREDVNQRRNEEFASVLQSANRALKSIAEREGFDAVFQDAAYANPKLDLTDKVLKALADAK